MTYRTISYIGALSAIVGGALRVPSGFIHYEEANLQLEVFYGLIDLFLLFGLCTLYLQVAEKLGWLGLVSFLVAATGLASIVGPDTSMWGVNLYQLGAAVLMVGLSAFAAVMLWTRVMKQAGLYWIAAFAVGISAIVSGSPLAFSVAGMLFGLGFVTAGVAVVLELEEAPV